MFNPEELLEKLEENIEHIKKYGVKEIGLFGSYVRNEQKSESDIDILVKFEPGKKTFDNYMDLKFFLEDLFNRKVDLVVTEALKPDLKQYILGSVKYATSLYFEAYLKAILDAIRKIENYTKDIAFLKSLTAPLITVSGRRWL